ncbi:MAG: transporter substrate-binding domain-containing protein [Ruminococcaceae bacterium]|nr:transporter substrate-binding domain-containing protein [Oscillospiraceae bacterium]
MKQTKRLIACMMALLMVLSCGFAFSSCGKNEEVINVGYTLYAPMNYKDTDGKLIGFDTELAEAVFKNMGYKVNFVEIKWENKYTDLASHTIDCIWNGFTANTADDDGVARADKVDFSYNYMKNKQVVVIKEGTTLAAKEDFAGKTGVAETGSAGEGYAASFEGAKVKGVTRQTDALMEVNTGTADFAVLDEQLAKNYCGNGDYSELKIVEEFSSNEEFYAIGFAKGSGLTALVNEQLERLAGDGTIAMLAKKYGLENTVITSFADQKQ